jgi:SSS family solute:Na+ symporter
MMTFLATQVGGCLMLGSAEEAYRFSWPVLLYPLGCSLGLLCLGLGLGAKIASLGVTTTAQIFESIYNSPFLKKVASLLSIVTLFMILVTQVIGSQKFMVSIGVDNLYIFLGFWAIVILYTALGGMKAVVATDLVQAAFFSVVFIFCFFYILSADSSVSLASSSANFSFSSEKFTGWLLMPLLFMIIEQDMAQRCFAAKAPKVVSKAALWAAIGTFLLGAIAVTLGIVAKNGGVEIPAGASVLITTVIAKTTPLISAIAACAVLAAIISTADSLINAIGSNLSQDFALFKSRKVASSQMICIVIPVLAILISFSFQNIIDLMIISYELSVSCLFVPTFAALFMKEGKTLSAAAAVACGASSFVLFQFVPAPLPREILSLLLSTAGFVAGEFVARRALAQPLVR